jgi:hypothetical protein
MSLIWIFDFGCTSVNSDKAIRRYIHLAANLLEILSAKTNIFSKGDTVCDARVGHQHSIPFVFNKYGYRLMMISSLHPLHLKSTNSVIN